MNLILWRHAEAEDGSPDLERRLTDKGKRQARLMAEWLRPRLPDDLRILVSPAIRTRQTADALDMIYTIANEIAPDAEPANVLAAAGWPAAEDSVLVVGHQPTLGSVASLLLFGKENSMSLKKGAIVWIVRQQQEGVVQNRLQEALSPEMLGDFRK
jgi:phosphohistidine phosphatase